MKQVVIVLHLSTQEEKKITISQWRIYREQEKRTGRKLYKLLDIVDEQAEPKVVSRSLKRFVNPSVRRAPQPPKKKKKKSCCGG